MPAAKSSLASLEKVSRLSKLKNPATNHTNHWQALQTRRPLRLRSTSETARNEYATQLFSTSPLSGPCRVYHRLYPGEFKSLFWASGTAGDWESGRSDPHCHFVTLWKQQQHAGLKPKPSGNLTWVFVLAEILINELLYFNLNRWESDI